MNWLTSGIVSALFSTFIIIIVYGYLFLSEKKRYFKLWVTTYILQFFKFSIMLISSINGDSVYLFLIYHFLTILSSMFLIWGIYDYINRKMKYIWNVVAVFAILWTIIGKLVNINFTINTFPEFIFLGTAGIWTGLIFAKSNLHKQGKYFLTTLFVLWGMHKIDYPFLRTVPWFAPIGYYLDGFLLFSIAIVILILYFQKTKTLLIESEDRLRNVLEYSQDAAYRRNLVTGKYDYVSPVVERLMGYTVGELTSMGRASFLEKVHPEDQYIVNEKNKDLLSATTTIGNIEYRFLCKDGSYKWFQDRYKSINDVNSGLFYRYGVLQDVTEDKLIEVELRKAKAEAEAYDRLKTEFFSNISHELRTPLNILLSSLQLINIYVYKLQGNEGEDIKKYLGIMKQNCFRLLRLINNFLDITKIDAGFYNLNEGKHNIVSIVEDITTSVVEYLKNKNIQIIFDTEIEEKYISCDDDKIERIMLNLFSNAIKFTNPGGKIEVNIYERNNEIIISVKDTGIGIPKDKLTSIFDRFSQVDKTLSRNKEGTGIGLALVKSLVEMHKGKIIVKSTYGEGTEFLIHLPENLNKIDDNDVNLNNKYEDKKESNMEKMNIEFSDIVSIS